MSVPEIRRDRSPTWSGRFRVVLSTAVVLLGVVPGGAVAHAFVQPYTLPVPLALYAFGAAIALMFSFAVVGLLASRPALAQDASISTSQAPLVSLHTPRISLGGTLALGLLVLCIATGLFGTRNAYANFNMTFFWLVFVLGVPYLTALLGDFYAAVNPWKTLVAWVHRFTSVSFEGYVAYPEKLAYYPALVLYIAFIWLELFGRLSPYGLSVALAAYTAINLAGAWLFGSRCWFRYGEFFAVMLRLIGTLSPWARSWDPEVRAMSTSRRCWRAPFAGLAEERVEHVSLLLFILFMLSSTAFDGLHSTQPWVALFWKGLYPSIAPLLGAADAQQYALSTKLYYVWQWCSLIVSPFVYYAVYVVFICMAARLMRTTLTTRQIALRFALSLVPIAFVYHVTHYYTMLISQGGQIVRLVSDPFGASWNLFGTANLKIAPMLIDIEWIWHTQVALILIGHIVGVYYAHVEALRLVAHPRLALFSQVPMLVLMMSFTTLGLWILSLPLA